MGAIVKAWQALLAALGLAAVAGASSSAQAKPAPTPQPTPGGSGGVRPPKGSGTKRDYQAVAANARKLAQILGYSDKTAQWFERFAMVQSWSESRGNFAAANETASEKAAARRAYDGQLEVYGDRFQPIADSAPAAAFFEEFGSGGWFGLIPSYGLHAFTGEAAIGDVHPYDVFDPWRSTVMMAAFAERLTNRSNFRQLSPADKNAYALKRGFAAGSLIDNVSGHPRGDISNKHVDQAVAALGIPEGWKRQPIPAEFYREPDSWLAIMRAGEVG